MWYYNNEPFEGPIDDWIGFVYCITNKVTNKKYIGKKFFWSKKTLPPLKGQKRKRRSVIESDWKKYFGSNKELIEESKDSVDNYHREILKLCKKRADCAYYEMKEQIEREVLFDKNYYNEFIGGKIHSSHLTHD
jgi:hypothetical protein|tara:strand:+ start:1110 stop:1511 length:402 start_codon:yes stop_codon:yes gene_type:complete